MNVSSSTKYYRMLGTINDMNKIFPDTLWVTVGQVVWPPEPLKVKRFLKMFKNAEKWAKSASIKTGLFGHFFSKCCHSNTNKDIDMRPKLVEA